MNSTTNAYSNSSLGAYIAQEGVYPFFDVKGVEKLYDFVESNPFETSKKFAYTKSLTVNPNPLLEKSIAVTCSQETTGKSNPQDATYISDCHLKTQLTKNGIRQTPIVTPLPKIVLGQQPSYSLLSAAQDFLRDPKMKQREAAQLMQERAEGVADLYQLLSKKITLRKAKDLLTIHIETLLRNLSKWIQFDYMKGLTNGNPITAELKYSGLTGSRVLSLLSPLKNVLSGGEGSFVLDTTASIYNNITTLLYKIGAPEAEYFLTVSHSPNKTTTIRSLSSVVKDWKILAQSWPNYYLTETTQPENPDFSTLEVFHEKPSFSNLFSQNLTLPKKEDLLAHSFCLVGGLAMSYSGFSYAKSNYENENKPFFRKTAGIIAGLGTGLFGIGLASVPFGLKI